MAGTGDFFGKPNVFEKNGLNFEVRFFDANSFFDLRDLREIVQSPGVQEWMSSVRNMTHKHYGKWMNEKGHDDHFLFAIAGYEPVEDTQLGAGIQRVHGFIYAYPSEIMRGAMEVSYAKRPGAPGGLIAPALKVTAKIIKEMKGTEPKILAEIERGNEASIVAIEKAEFVKYRNFDREGNGLWILDWKLI